MQLISITACEIGEKDGQHSSYRAEWPWPFHVLDGSNPKDEHRSTGGVNDTPFSVEHKQTKNY